MVICGKYKEFKESCECGLYPDIKYGKAICPRSLKDSKHKYVPWSLRGEKRVKIGKYSGHSKRYKGGYELF